MRLYTGEKHSKKNLDLSVKWAHAVRPYKNLHFSNYLSEESQGRTRKGAQRIITTKQKAERERVFVFSFAFLPKRTI